MAPLIVFILSAWCLLSVLNQLPLAMNERVRQLDFFHLVPRWTFFAPNPGISDYHLVYRIKRQTDEFDAWQEIHWLGGRNWFSCVWNPTKRRCKLQLDATMAIMSLYRQNAALEEGALVLTIPYLLLLNAVCSHCSDQDADSID